MSYTGRINNDEETRKERLSAEEYPISSKGGEDYGFGKPSDEYGKKSNDTDFSASEDVDYGSTKNIDSGEGYGTNLKSSIADYDKNNDYNYGKKPDEKEEDGYEGTKKDGRRSGYGGIGGSDDTAGGETTDDYDDNAGRDEELEEPKLDNADALYESKNTVDDQEEAGKKKKSWF